MISRIVHVKDNIDAITAWIIKGKPADSTLSRFFTEADQTQYYNRVENKRRLEAALACSMYADIKNLSTCETIAIYISVTNNAVYNAIVNEGTIKPISFDSLTYGESKQKSINKLMHCLNGNIVVSTQVILVSVLMLTRLLETEADRKSVV